MDLQLGGKRAVVTGSTAGIGLAIAIDLAREQANVVVNGRTQERVDAALARIRSEVREARVEGVAADLGTAAAELTAATQVTVNSVLAGPTRSEGVGAFVEGLARQQNKDAAQVERDFFRHMRPTSLLQRFAEPAEVAHLVTFLASPLSSATNGAALRVDGGVVRAVV